MGIRKIFQRVFSRGSSEAEWTPSTNFEPYTPGQVTKTFTATVADEISVPRGSTVKALYRDDQWIYVQVKDGRRGFVPYSYCKLSSCQSNDRRWEKSNLQRFIDSLPVEKDEGELFETSKKGEATVIFDFHAVAHDDLEARENQIVTILNCSDSDWVFCRNSSDQVGFIPTSHLQMPPLPSTTSINNEKEKRNIEKWENENLLVVEPFSACTHFDLTVRPGEWIKCLGGPPMDDWIWAQRLADDQQGFIPTRIVILATDL